MSCLNPDDAQTARLFTADGPFQTLSANSGGGMQRHGVCMERECRMMEEGKTMEEDREMEEDSEMASYGINPQGGQMLPFHEEQGETVAVSHGSATMQTGVADMEYVVRRLTPVECERLQGLPDGWTVPAFRPEEITDELVGEFMRIHDTFGAVMAKYEGKTPPKPKTAAYVRKWLERISDPATCPDAPRYKGCGNGMATNQPRWIFLRMLAKEGVDPWEGPLTPPPSATA